jgi:hypothetical protein
VTIKSGSGQSGSFQHGLWLRGLKSTDLVALVASVSAFPRVVGFSASPSSRSLIGATVYSRSKRRARDLNNLSLSHPLDHLGSNEFCLLRREKKKPFTGLLQVLASPTGLHHTGSRVGI